MGCTVRRTTPPGRRRCQRPAGSGWHRCGESREIIAQGECDGQIIYEEKGENGFGYDSLFFSPEKGCTFAELETVEKKKISHRAKALAVLKSKLTA